MDGRAGGWPEEGRLEDRLREPVELVRAALDSDPGAGLEAVARLRHMIDAWEDRQVEQARGMGWNWAEIAKRLGRHRQAVHREYARRTRPAPGELRRDTA